MKKSHLYHLVDCSPWPLLSSLAVFFLTSGFVLYMHSMENGFFIFMLGLVMLGLVLMMWWSDVVSESTYKGNHTLMVQSGMKLGFMLFLATEVMFFSGFFWAFFHTSLSPSVFMGTVWPPVNVVFLSPWGVPMLNTAMLLLSGFSMTWVNYAMMEGDYSSVKNVFILMLSLAVMFKMLMISEKYLKKEGNIIFIMIFLTRMFFGNLWKTSKLKMNGNVAKKSCYSESYKFNDEFKKTMMGEMNYLIKGEKMTGEQGKLLLKYMKNNFEHTKIGELFVEKDGSVVFEAYDLTSKGKGRVYCWFDGKEDKYMSVYKNKEGTMSYVNKVTLKKKFENVEEFKKNVDKVSDDDMEKELGMEKGGKEVIVKSMKEVHNKVNVEKGGSKQFLLDDKELKKGDSLNFKDFNKDEKNDDFSD